MSPIYPAGGPCGILARAGKGACVSDVHALDAIAEVRAIDALIRAFPRRADQLNGPHEADAELVPLGPDRWLAATVDILAGELAVGFYQDWHTTGWTLVQASLSDLAAVGATPLGVLLAITRGPDGLVPERLAAGIADALRAEGVAALGGDLDDGAALNLSATALGLVEGTPPLTRLGIRPGDALYATGPLGGGNALAIARLTGAPAELWPEERYRPRARLAEGRAARGVARAAIDTSDGPMSAIDHLARLNGVGFRLDFDLSRLLLPAAREAFTAAGLPAWALFAGEHGEYELIAGVAPAKEAALQAAWPSCVRLGEATAARGLALSLPDGRTVPFDGSFVRNLLATTGGDWRAYTREFAAYGAALGLS